MEKSRMAQASFLSFLLSFFFMICSNAEDINIDCGSLTPLTDGDKRTWIGDTSYVTTGSTSKLTSGEVNDPLRTLRYFPTGDTNCYSNILVEKGEKILVRTRFNYGNYDGDFNSPRFDVVYDGKHRDSVTTSSFSTLPTFSEAIFIPENGNISVCFVRTFLTEHPLVSTIEVRKLDKSLYSELGPKEGFILQQRTAFGRQELVRSPYDLYDRFWVPGPLGLTPLTSAATSINTTSATNQPPEIILRTSRSSKSMTLFDIDLPFAGVTFYLVMYFSEPISLASDQKRSFEVYYDDKQVGPSLIEPPFAAVTQISLRGVVVSVGPYLEFKSTPDSTLDPLINALELYLITNSGGSGNGTNSTDTGGGGGGSPGSPGSPSSPGSPESPSSRGSPGTPDSPEEKSSDSSGKTEEGKGSNLALPLGISLPSLFVLASAGFGVWQFIIKPKRTRESERPLKHEVHVSVQVAK